MPPLEDIKRKPGKGLDTEQGGITVDRPAREDFGACLPLWLLMYSALMMGAYSILYVVHYGVRGDAKYTENLIAWGCVGIGCFVVALVAFLRARPSLVTLVTYTEQGERNSPTTGQSESASLIPGKEDKATSGNRIPQVDYFKLLVNMCVVFHHAYEYRSGKPDNTPFMEFWRAFTEPWLMPSMALLSGLVFTPVLTQRRRQGVLQLAAGYFIMQALYQVIIKAIIESEDKSSATYLETLQTLNKPVGTVSLIDVDDPLPWARMVGNLLRPAGHLWFIWSLFMWRIMVPFWMDLKYPVLCSVGMAAMTGFVQSNSLNIYRTLYFFPYYVIGNLIKMDGFRPFLFCLCNDRIAKVWGAVVMVIGGLAGVYAVSADLCGWYFGAQYSYKQVAELCAEGHQTGIDNRYWLNMFATVATYPTAVGFVFAMIFIMPTEETAIRRAGERTLAPYVWHVFFLFFLSFCTYLTSDYRAINVIPLFVVLYGFVALIYTQPALDNALRTAILPPLDKWGFFKED